MTGRFYSTPIGNELPPWAEVVWNGTFDRALARAQQQPTPAAHLGFGQPNPAWSDAYSLRDCDRVLRYLEVQPTLVHSSRSVADALAIDVRSASVWLARFTRRGILTRQPGARTGYVGRGGQAGHLYRVSA